MTRKALVRMSVAAPLVAALLLAGSAEAAGPYTFQLAASPTQSQTRGAFTRGGCTMSSVATVNGTDARVLELPAGFAGRTLRLASRAALGTQGWLTPTFYTSGCEMTFDSANSTRLTPQGASTLKAPAGARYLVVEGLGNAQVSFDLTVIA